MSMDLEGPENREPKFHPPGTSAYPQTWNERRPGRKPFLPSDGRLILDPKRHLRNQRNQEEKYGLRYMQPAV